ncbi:DUF4214 domain-containing protein [Paenibacillus alvei]|uniref:DUF4214 domain-containing protein n=1 Tax=Paenibacillus alvei TaxID=44250 RepID=A0ABT4H439_PAEAL|nr:DUF4214 domain-containing protein [Paenibacillus alvei]MCY9763513.1 DUF4214 domain-containing protein [Paenibacillus alvei]MCY9767475.1 DUF4214 domain-containing protein [Paenibacillus alvei]
MKQQYRVIHFIHALLKLDGLDFIRELYRQFLHRQPSEMEYHHFLKLLAIRQTKLKILCKVMCSKEAEQLFDQPPAGFIHFLEETTATSILRRFYLSEPIFFIHSLYNEFLLRNPDSDGLHAHLNAILSGIPRKKLLRSFLASQECQGLLASSYIPLNDDPHLGYNTGTVHPFRHSMVTHIGIFLGYPNPQVMEGEGIGRFLYRLIDGLLTTRPEVHIHIAATEYNYSDTMHTFGSLISLYPGRVHFTKSNNIEWFNTNVQAQVWIVPILSLELALYLTKPYILCLHDLVHHEFKELYFSTFPEFCYRVDRTGYLVLEKAAAIVSNSNYVRSHHAIHCAGMPAEKTHVIRLAPPSNEYQSCTLIDEAQFRMRYKIFHDYLVYPTALRLHKNFERLIMAFIRFRQSLDGYHSHLRLVFTDQLTDIPSHAEVTGMLQRISDEEIRNSIIFLGRIPKSDLPSLYKYAMGTIVPTLFEGSCPFPILESLTMGTPVAAANLEVTNEVIKDMKAFLAFSPYSIEEIEIAIRGLWMYHDQLLDLQQAAISDAMQRSWTDVANEYFNLIQNIIEKAHENSPF